MEDKQNVKDSEQGKWLGDVTIIPIKAMYKINDKTLAEWVDVSPAAISRMKTDYYFAGHNWGSHIILFFYLVIGENDFKPRSHFIDLIKKRCSGFIDFDSVVTKNLKDAVSKCGKTSDPMKNLEKHLKKYYIYLLNSENPELKDALKAIERNFPSIPEKVKKEEESKKAKSKAKRENITPSEPVKENTSTSDIVTSNSIFTEEKSVSTEAPDNTNNTDASQMDAVDKAEAIIASNVNSESQTDESDTDKLAYSENKEASAQIVETTEDQFATSKTTNPSSDSDQRINKKAISSNVSTRRKKPARLPSSTTVPSNSQNSFSFSQVSGYNSTKGKTLRELAEENKPKTLRELAEEQRRNH